MATTTRYLEAQVARDLERKMVFVTGPRQVGKTTLAQGQPGAGAGYLSWDVPADRERILRRELPVADLWIFDEIHKYGRWRDFLKGLYDARREKQRILVTGSGRLELFGFGGDSLQGRYHLLRLHPSRSPKPASTMRTDSRRCRGSADPRSPFSAAAKPGRIAGPASTACAWWRRKSPHWDAFATWAGSRR